MAPSAIGWLGFVAAFALAALLYIARQRRAELAGAPWVAPWSASEGGPADEPPAELTIQEIMLYRPTILVWVLRHGVPARDAEDVTQNVVKGAWASRHRFDRRQPGGSLGAWLYRIAFHHACNYHAHAHVRREVLVADPLAGAVAGEDPEAAMVLRQEAAQAAGILERLPAHLASVLARIEVEGEPMRELAAELGLPLGTAQGQLRQARQAAARGVARARARRR
jgi:RNA polymerase sigma-70 factor (ECF subfamily)